MQIMTTCVTPLKCSVAMTRPRATLRLELLKTMARAPMRMPVTIAAEHVWPMRTATVSAIHLKWLVVRMQTPAITIRLRPMKTVAAQNSMKSGNAEATAPLMRIAMACVIMWIPV